MNKAVLSLNLAVDKLISARNDFEARVAMALLTDALSEEITDDERVDIHKKLVSNLRSKAFSMAQKHYKAQPDNYPDYIFCLLDAVPVLQRRYAAMSDFPDSDVSPREFLQHLNQLSGCRSPEEVSAFLNEMMEYLDAHPEYQKDGYGHLISVVKSEIIAAYMEKPEEHGWRERYILTLLCAVEDSVHYCYTLNFLYYEDGIFEMVSPDNLAEETDIGRLSRKLELLQEAMASVHPYFLEGYLNRLSKVISRTVVETLSNEENGEEMPAHLIALMDYLVDLDFEVVRSAATNEEPAEDSPMENLLNAQAMLHNLCIHEDTEYLENDWAEFLSGAAGCPACGELLKEQAYAAISIRVMTELMAQAADSVPETTLCLMRLFLALYTSPVTNTLDDDVLKWVIRGNAA